MKLKSVALAMACLLAAPAFADPVETFRGLCMAQLDNVPALRAAAQKQGFKITDLGANSFMGARKRTDESIQVNVFTKARFECAVTTSDVADPEALRARFFSALGVQTRKSRVKAQIQGRSYVISFDTQGGEAMVIAR